MATTVINRAGAVNPRSRPVLIGALGGTKHGHAWVLDGWMERRQILVAVRDSDGHRTVVNRNVQDQKLVHCNWGWEGSCNGYYVSGTFFSPGDGNEIPDNGAGSSDSYFSWWFRTVTVSR